MRIRLERTSKYIRKVIIILLIARAHELEIRKSIFLKRKCERQSYKANSFSKFEKSIYPFIFFYVNGNEIYIGCLKNLPISCKL